MWSGRGATKGFWGSEVRGKRGLGAFIGDFDIFRQFVGICLHLCSFVVNFNGVAGYRAWAEAGGGLNRLVGLATDRRRRLGGGVGVSGRAAREARVSFK